MKTFALLVFLVAAVHSAVLPSSQDDARVTIVSRAGWGARPPNGFTTMSTPVLYVVIHHSFIPGACTTASACEAAMRSMQNMHMNTNGWADIGYSFAVGGDARAYEGRGWTRVGAHAPGFNDRSIGICTIGDWTSALPPAGQLNVLRQLIAHGVSLGRISSNYRLIGHRQAVATDCPGNALYNEIRTWPNWVATPMRDDLAEDHEESKRIAVI